MSSIEFHRRRAILQRIARHAATFRAQREAETKPAEMKPKGTCPHCGKVFARGLGLHIYKKHGIK